MIVTLHQARSVSFDPLLQSQKYSLFSRHSRPTATSPIIPTTNSLAGDRISHEPTIPEIASSWAGGIAEDGELRERVVRSPKFVPDFGGKRDRLDVAGAFGVAETGVDGVLRAWRFNAALGLRCG